MSLVKINTTIGRQHRHPRRAFFTLKLNKIVLIEEGVAEVQGCVIMNPNKMSVVYPSCGVTWPAGGMSTNKILFPVMATILNKPKPIT